MRYVLLVIGLTFCCLLSSTVSAQREPQIGAGAFSCGEWLDARSRHDESASLTKAMAASWIQGFLVAMASNKANFVEMKSALNRIPDGLSIEPWADKYCREHPLQGVLEAAGQLAWEISRP